MMNLAYWNRRFRRFLAVAPLSILHFVNPPAGEPLPLVSKDGQYSLDLKKTRFGRRRLELSQVVVETDAKGERVTSTSFVTIGDTGISRRKAAALEANARFFRYTGGCSLAIRTDAKLNSNAKTWYKITDLAEVPTDCGYTPIRGR
jgi:hypothetical protein